MARRYTGNTDGNAGRTLPGTRELFRLASKRWQFVNLGLYQNRRMNNPRADRDPLNPKYLSVHATGRAVDMGYRSRRAAVQCWEFLVTNSAALQIEEVHDYAYRWPNQDPADKTAWGAGYRCSRGEGLAGVRIFTARNNAGTPGGRWLHVELSPYMANNPREFRRAWIAALRSSGLK